MGYCSEPEGQKQEVPHIAREQSFSYRSTTTLTLPLVFFCHFTCEYPIHP
jgi:hypothetical protein